MDTATELPSPKVPDSSPQSVLAYWDKPPSWDKTSRAAERLSNHHAFFEEQGPEQPIGHGIFKGRHIIGRDTQINGGVHVGSRAREAIVVDDVKYPELQEIYRKILNKVRSNPQRLALTEVYETTRSLLPYDLEGVKRINEKYGVNDDKKITLTAYIDAKVGVCRHQALLAGYLLQKLKADGYLQGNASVDRNSIPGRGGHAWVRYTNRAGEIIIIDVAQNFIGPLSEINSDLHWFYKRPEDK